MNGDDQTTRALAREVGRHSVERLNESLTRITGEASGLFRWLLTMVFVLNAGGFWFCFAYPGSLLAGGPGELVTLFGVGALTAILAGLISLALTVPVARSMRQALTHWTEVSVSGALSDEALVHSRRVKFAGRLWFGATALIGLISLLLFVMGVAIATNGFSAARGASAAPDELDLLNESVNAALPVENAANAVANVAVNATVSTPAPVRTTPTPTPTRAVTQVQPAQTRPAARPSASPTTRPSPPRQPAATTTPAAAPPAAPSPPPVAAPSQPVSPPAQ